MTRVKYESVVSSSGPLIWWRCHDASGSLVADSSGFNNTASYLGSDQLWGLRGINNDPLAKAIRLNQSAVTYNAGILYNPATAFDTAKFTIEWVERDITAAANRTLFSYAVTGQSDEFRLVRTSASSFALFVKGVSATLNFLAGTVTDVGARNHHMAVSYDGGTYALYVNGVVADTTFNTASLTAGGSFAVGQDQDSVGGGFVTTDALRLTISEIAIYNTALDTTTLQNHATAAGTSYYEYNIVSSSVDSLDWTADVNDFIAGEKVFYFQRVWDNSNSVWCYWTDSIITQTPTTTMTTPNHSGNISNHGVINIVRNYQIP